VGTGRNVGVAGRDDGVGIELPEAAVLTLAPDSRDCGRFVVEKFIVLRASEATPLTFPLVEPLDGVGDVLKVDDGRNVV
jgi:hypothetical protein